MKFQTLQIHISKLLKFDIKISLSSYEVNEKTICGSTCLIRVKIFSQK